MSTKADSPTQAARHSGLVSAPAKTADQPSPPLQALDRITDAVVFPQQTVLHHRPPPATEDTACHSVAAAPTYGATAPAKSDPIAAATACFDACHQTLFPTEVDPPNSGLDAAASGKPGCTATIPADTQDLVPVKTASAKAGCPATPWEAEMHETTSTTPVSAASAGACCEADSQEPLPAAAAPNAAGPVITTLNSSSSAAPLALPELNHQATAPVEPGSAASGLNCTSSPQPEPAAVSACFDAGGPASVPTAALSAMSRPIAQALACIQADLQEIVPSTALGDGQANKTDAAPADCRAATADAAPAVHQTAPVGADLAKSPIAQLPGSPGDCQAAPADVEPLAAAAPSSAAKGAEPVCSDATSLFCIDAEAAASLHPLLQIIAASARTKSASAALAATHLSSEGSLPSIAVAAKQASNPTEATVHAAEQGTKE